MQQNRPIKNRFELLLHFSKLTLLILVFTIPAGCASRAMNNTIDSWQGQQLSAVVAVWGQPSEELKIEGKRLLIWNTYAGKTATAGTKGAVPPSGGGYCVRLLQADRKGRIVEGAWDGNDCPGWFSGWAR